MRCPQWLGCTQVKLEDEVRCCYMGSDFFHWECTRIMGIWFPEWKQTALCHLQPSLCPAARAGQRLCQATEGEAALLWGRESIPHCAPVLEPRCGHTMGVFSWAGEQMILKWPSSGLGRAPALPVLQSPEKEGAALGWPELLGQGLVSCTAEPCPGKQKPQVSTGSGILMLVNPSATLAASTSPSANKLHQLRGPGAASTWECSGVCPRAYEKLLLDLERTPSSQHGLTTPPETPRESLQSWWLILKMTL